MGLPALHLLALWLQPHHADQLAQPEARAFAVSTAEPAALTCTGEMPPGLFRDRCVGS